MKLGLIISSLLYFVTMMSMGNQGCNGCLEKERIGLLEIKHYILSQKGDPLNALGSWVDDRGSNCCSWNRVKCSNTTSGHITELSIGSLLLEPHLYMLNVSLFRPFEELRFLNLSDNWFGGWIGNEGFPRLTKLETLDLSFNYLNSSILPSLNGLTALTTLNLAVNKMENFSAQGFPRLTKLETLDLSVNLLDSSILPSLNELTALTTLNLRANSIENFSAQGFPRLTKLETLDLSFNYLNSSILPSFNGLTTLNLAGNLLENFSAQGFLRSKELKVLDLSENGLNCNIITSLQGLTSLRSLILSYNEFNCSLSTLDFAKFSRLELLDLSGNHLFIGSLHVEGFPRLTKLETLDLSWNDLNSSILPSLNGLTALTTLNLAVNKMENFSAQDFVRFDLGGF